MPSPLARALFCTAVLALLGASARADELVDLKLDSKPRKYGPKDPLQAEKQEFSLSKPGVLTLVHVIDPFHKDARSNFFTLEEVNLRNYVIGPGIFQERIPDDAIPGQKRQFKQQWLCPPRKEPLNLRATIVAPHRPDGGDQLGASQRLTIGFVPFEKISSEPEPKPAIDVSGKWLHGEANAVWTLTPKGDGEYEAVEKGYDNAKGTARVKGRKVYIDWVTTTAKDGQKRGVTVVEAKEEGKGRYLDGWSVGEHGAGGEKFTAWEHAGAKPLPPAAGGGAPGAGAWEHKVLDLPAAEAFGAGFEKRLNELGAEGWEAVGVVVPPAPKDAGAVRLVLKRPKR